MKYYIELTLFDYPDYRMYELWGRLYMQLHLALVEVKDNQDKVNVGVSFPEYHFDEIKQIGALGSKIRLFAQERITLEQLNIRKWLNRLVDYVHISPIFEVPDDIKGYAIYNRVQVKNNAERLARRQLKKHQNLDFEQTVLRYQNIVTTCHLPYISFKSLSSKRPFNLFIEKKEVPPTLNVASFNTYGLGTNCALPEF
ncbi:type I-F CRISPR-associated endoribonuclease Cas6/Csy4 [Gallibacterium salpingitidis]|uniref:CRISPR-associated protein n=1 Tax=Gallibacterium salpingitidis TaxID=505341 RepID=A0A1A7NVM3_9PAST|nr:type I-F CRISPR-associated endoribonuclease Cas6/Csy4 [Gallibacterium salpingitidis]OBW93551.1 hypothetical protein QS62_07270 [Gallibacterium salpingitidis]